MPANHPETGQTEIPRYGQVLDVLIARDGKRFRFLPQSATIPITSEHFMSSVSSAIPQFYTNRPVHSKPIINDLLRRSLERLAEIAKLAPAWDSYGAEAPSAQAIVTASALLVRLYDTFEVISGEFLPPHLISPLTDGGLQLEWSGPQAEVETQISAEGTLGYLLTHKHGTNRVFEEDDEVPLSKIIQLIVDVVRHN
jgi:hypothetical protein